MASSKTLNTKNLEALGAARLAELLIEVSAGDAGAKRRLRLELAGTAGVGEVARQIQKRLATIGKARSFIEWNKVRPLVEDLRAQYRAIVDQVAKRDASAALDLLWRFMALAEPVHARCDDSSGRVGEVFRSAAHDLLPLAEAAGAKPLPLADKVFEALRANGYGQFDELIKILSPRLGPEGLGQLKERFTEWSKEERPKPAEHERRVVGWSSGSGRLYADDIEDQHRKSTVRLALQQIADALGDVDGFIAQQDERARKAPAVAAQIGMRLLDAGRAEEALTAIDAAEARGGWVPVEWEQARIRALVALGRDDEAQAFRWDRFLKTLSPQHLRDHLKKLPDFDDLDAEERALDHALRHPDVHRALAFLIGWPALDRAARLVLDRAAELDGNLYELLTPAAEALEERHPLAATMLLRAMIDLTLARAKSTRYRHAARHLQTCASLAKRIDGYGTLPDHDSYVAQLKTAHGRKAGFWSAS